MTVTHQTAMITCASPSRRMALPRCAELEPWMTTRVSQSATVPSYGQGLGQASALPGPRLMFEPTLWPRLCTAANLSCHVCSSHHFLNRCTCAEKHLAPQTAFPCLRTATRGQDRSRGQVPKHSAGLLSRPSARGGRQPAGGGGLTRRHRGPRSASRSAHCACRARRTPRATRPASDQNMAARTLNATGQSPVTLSLRQGPKAKAFTAAIA